MSVYGGLLYGLFTESDIFGADTDKTGRSEIDSQVPFSVTLPPSQDRLEPRTGQAPLFK